MMPTKNERQKPITANTRGGLRRPKYKQTKRATKVRIRLTPSTPTISHDVHESVVSDFALPETDRYQTSSIHVVCPNNCKMLSENPTKAGRLEINSLTTCDAVGCPASRAISLLRDRSERVTVTFFFCFFRATQMFRHLLRLKSTHNAQDARRRSGSTTQFRRSVGENGFVFNHKFMC